MLVHSPSIVPSLTTLSSHQWSDQKPTYSALIYVVSCDFVVLSSQCLYTVCMHVLSHDSIIILHHIPCTYIPYTVPAVI